MNTTSFGYEYARLSPSVSTDGLFHIFFQFGLFSSVNFSYLNRVTQELPPRDPRPPVPPAHAPATATRYRLD